MTIFSKKTQGHLSPYRTAWQMWTPWGKLKVHLFHRGDMEKAWHDHPADFWTFPLTSYVEQPFDTETKLPQPYRLVRRFRLHKRKAEFAHRLIGKAVGPHGIDINGRIWTLVFEKHNHRRWGFWTGHRGFYGWTYWEDHLERTGQIPPRHKNCRCVLVPIEEAKEASSS